MSKKPSKRLSPAMWELLIRANRIDGAEIWSGQQATALALTLRGLARISMPFGSNPYGRIYATDKGKSRLAQDRP